MSNRINYTEYNSIAIVYAIISFIRGEKLDIYFPEDENIRHRTVSLIAHHGLTGHILNHKNFSSLDTNLQKAIKSLYLRISVRNTQLFETYNSVTDKFKERNIEFIPLKGAFLLPTIYGDIAARNISDLDILIHPEDYERCKAILVEMGATQVEEESEQFLQNLAHQYAPYWLFNTSIELHNRILSLNLKYAISVDEVWSNLVDYKLNDTVCKGIDPNILVIYLAMHIHYSEMRGEYRVYWYMDIAKLLSLNEKVNMVEVLGLSKRYGNYKPLIKILSKVSYMFNLDIEGVKRLNDNQIESLLRNLAQFNKPANKGYSIAIERVLYTKGFKNRLQFVKQSVLAGSGNSNSDIFKRISSIGVKLLQYLFKRQR